MLERWQEHVLSGLVTHGHKVVFPLGMSLVAAYLGAVLHKDLSGDYENLRVPDAPERIVAKDSVPDTRGFVHVVTESGKDLAIAPDEAFFAKVGECYSYEPVSYSLIGDFNMVANPFVAVPAYFNDLYSPTVVEVSRSKSCPGGQVGAKAIARL